MAHAAWSRRSVLGRSAWPPPAPMGAQDTPLSGAHAKSRTACACSSVTASFNTHGRERRPLVTAPRRGVDAPVTTWSPRTGTSVPLASSSASSSSSSSRRDLDFFAAPDPGHCPAITTPRRDSGAAVRLVASLSPSVSRPRHGLTDSSADGRLRWWNDHRSGRSRVPAAPSAAPCRPPDTDAEYPAHPATARSETSAMTPRGRRRGAAPSPASSASRALVPANIPRLRPHRASPAASSAPASTSRGSSGTLSSRRPRPDTAEAIAENMSTDAARSYSPRAPLSERSRKRMRVLSYCSAGQRLNNENLDSDSFAYVSRVKPRQLVNYHHFECTYENCVIIQLGDF